MIERTRRAFRHEQLPAHLRWWWTSDGIAYWLRLVEGGLSKAMGSRDAARSAMSAAAAPAFEARFARESVRGASTAHWVLAHYPGPIFRSVDWITADVGGPVRGARARAKAYGLVRGVPVEARWQEVTTHLGELLIHFTQQLPKHGLTQTSAVLGKICFDFGLAVARAMKLALRLPDTPSSAIEVLRMGEYLFRVNPHHESHADDAERTGFIEGDACPWYMRPGWGGVHCGIFGRFQDGCCQAFGLTYSLTRTIPRHGGSTCRIDIKPARKRSLPLVNSPEGSLNSAEGDAAARRIGAS